MRLVDWGRSGDYAQTLIEPSLYSETGYDGTGSTGSAGVLAKLRDIVEAQIGEKVENTVISSKKFPQSHV